MRAQERRLRSLNPFARAHRARPDDVRRCIACGRPLAEGERGIRLHGAFFHRDCARYGRDERV